MEPTSKRGPRNGTAQTPQAAARTSLRLPLRADEIKTAIAAFAASVSRDLAAPREGQAIAGTVRTSVARHRMEPLLLIEIAACSASEPRETMSSAGLHGHPRRKTRRAIHRPSAARRDGRSDASDHEASKRDVPRKTLSCPLALLPTMSAASQVDARDGSSAGLPLSPPPLATTVFGLDALDRLLKPCPRC